MTVANDTDANVDNYPIETRDGEIERLLTQAAAMAPDTAVLLDKIGVCSGWHCLDIGCGPGGITELLHTRVGPKGRVVGLDQNEAFLRYARTHAADGIEFINANAYSTGLPSNSFDCVHMRFIASTAGAPQRLIAEAKRLVRPGGIVVMQEPDGSTLNCYPPHPAWDKLKAALLDAFRGSGADLELAQRLYSIVYHSELDDVQYRTFLVAVRAVDPMVDYLPSTVLSLKGTILKLGLLTEAQFNDAIEHCRAHLWQPGTSFTMYTVAQVWGRKPL